MATKSILKRQRTISAVLAAFRAHVQEVLPALGERLTPFLREGETLPDFGLVQGLVGRLLDDVRTRLVEAEKLHLDELDQDLGPRFELRQLVSTVRSKLMAIRRIGEGLFGLERSAEIVPVEGPTAENPEALWRQAELTVSRLRKPDLASPSVALDAVDFVPSQVADELETDVTALRQSLDAVGLERRKAESTLSARDQMVGESDLVLRGSVRLLTGYFLLAGRPDLARRIRLTLRRARRSRPEDGETSTPSGSTEPPAADSDAGAGDPASA